MICPICGSETKVVCSRDDGTTVNRARKCLQCGFAIYTVELKVDYENWIEANRAYMKRRENDSKRIKKH